MAVRQKTSPSRMSRKQELGVWGEARALAYLISRGYRLREKNWRCAYGEVDIICTAPDNTLCFVEVRTSTTMVMGGAISSLTRRKRMSICRVAYCYIRDFTEAVPIRCDLIANQRVGGVWSLEHITDAFGAEH